MCVTRDTHTNIGSNLGRELQCIPPIVSKGVASRGGSTVHTAYSKQGGCTGVQISPGGCSPGGGGFFKKTSN